MTDLSTYSERPDLSAARNSHRHVDLDLPEFPPVAWSRAGIRHSLDELYAWSERLAVEAIGWYTIEKQRKARWSRTLRALVLMLTTAGVAVPVVALALARPTTGNWGYLLLALAAGCVACDRFFGQSASWQRYTATATSLRTQLIEYQAAWAKEMVMLAAREPDRADAVRLIDFVRTFTWNVNDTLRSETEAWLVEFHSRLAELESRLHQTEGGMARRGGLTTALPGPTRSVEDAEATRARQRAGNRGGEQ